MASTMKTVSAVILLAIAMLPFSARADYYIDNGTPTRTIDTVRIRCKGGQHWAKLCCDYVANTSTGLVKYHCEDDVHVDFWQRTRTILTYNNGHNDRRLVNKCWAETKWLGKPNQPTYKKTFNIKDLHKNKGSVGYDIVDQGSFGQNCWAEFVVEGSNDFHKTGGPGGRDACCSWNSRDCGNDAWCNKSRANCDGACNGVYIRA